MKILIMGLPGSGKSTLSEKLINEIGTTRVVDWLNADHIREQTNDWDFSEEGRRRQARRMRDLGDEATKRQVVCIADFVCPTKELRQIYSPDFVVWMDTIKEGRFEDTNRIFEPPAEDEYDIKITSFEEADRWPKPLADLIDILLTQNSEEWTGITANV